MMDGQSKNAIDLIMTTSDNWDQINCYYSQISTIYNNLVVNHNILTKSIFVTFHNTKWFSRKTDGKIMHSNIFHFFLV